MRIYVQCHMRSNWPDMEQEYPITKFIGHILKTIQHQTLSPLIFDNFDEIETSKVTPALDLLNRTSLYIQHWKSQNHSVIFLQKHHNRLLAALAAAQLPFDPSAGYITSGKVRTGIISLLWHLHECIRFLSGCSDEVLEDIAQMQLRPFTEKIADETIRRSARRSSMMVHVSEWKDAAQKWSQFLVLFDRVYPQVFWAPQAVLHSMAHSHPEYFWLEFWRNLAHLGADSGVTAFQVYLIRSIAVPLVRETESLCRAGLQTVIQAMERQSDGLRTLASCASMVMGLQELEMHLIPHPSLISHDVSSSFGTAAISRGPRDVVFRS